MDNSVKFDGFGDKALPFLKALGFHQTREWFHENKDIYYAQVKEPMGDLVEELSAKFAKAKLPLQGDRKKSLYRVNRDVRFSKNKEPYNTHASCMLTRNGTKKDNGFVFMHFSNERAFVASGFYGMEGDEMRGFRELILREPDTMNKLVKKMQKHGYVFDKENTLKRNPRGFEKVEDEKLQEYIRLKSFTFIDELTPEICTSSELSKRMFLLGKRSVDFLNFGWRAIDPVRESRDLSS